jgi:hypothetical protein
MADQSQFSGRPTQSLSIDTALDKLSRDPNRSYCKFILGLFATIEISVLRTTCISIAEDAFLIASG